MLNPFSPLLPPDTDNDQELESLQTDVMRFMAIVAFCLLVIFIPLVNKRPPIPPVPPEPICKIRFASADALLALVRSKKVSLYVNRVKAKELYQLYVQPNGETGFRPVKFSPGQLRNLDFKTVPRKIRSAFGRTLSSISDFEKDDVPRYGVRWSQEIDNNLQRAEAECKKSKKTGGGTVRIHENESVGFVPWQAGQHIDGGRS